MRTINIGRLQVGEEEFGQSFHSKTDHCPPILKLYTLLDTSVLKAVIRIFCSEYLINIEHLVVIMIVLQIICFFLYVVYYMHPVL